MTWTLVHIVGWPAFLTYVRPDRVHTARWRPSQLNFGAAELEALAEELTFLELGVYVRLVAAYAASPIIDPERPTGPRRLPLTRAEALVKTRNGQGVKVITRLAELGLVALVTPEGIRAEAEAWPKLSRGASERDPSSIRSSSEEESPMEQAGIAHDSAGLRLDWTGEDGTRLEAYELADSTDSDSSDTYQRVVERFGAEPSAVDGCGDLEEPSGDRR